MSDTLRFLQMMFPPELLQQGHKIVIWTHPNKLTKFFDNIEAAADYVIKISAADNHKERQNCYFGVGMIGRPPAKGRGAERDVTAITSLWLDIDIADGQIDRGKPNLPRTRKEAMALIEDIRCEPSIIVDSGHGFQAYWLLNDPWIFHNDQQRAQFKKFSKGWNDTARLCAQQKGFGLDSVHDLSRVFRLPGSWNIKGAPVLAKIIEPGGIDEPCRYDIDVLDMFIAPDYLCPGGAAHQPSSVIESVAPVLPQNNAGVPKIVLLACENDSKFRQTWENKRGDMADQSASAYDLSIATQLVRAGATDQEIVDAMYHWRLKYNQKPEKIQRRKYVMDTISRAKTGLGAERALDEITAMAHQQQPRQMSVELELDPEEEDEEQTGPADVDGAPSSEPPRKKSGRPKKVEPQQDPESETRRVMVLEKLSKALGFRIDSIIKHGIENSLYTFRVVDAGDISIGNIDKMFNQDHVRAKIADAIGIVIRVVKKPQWHQMVGIMLSVATVVKNNESSRSAQILYWLSRYLFTNERKIFRDDSWSEALIDSDPFMRDGIISISIPELQKFIKLDQMENIPKQELWNLLHHIGFKNETVSARHKKKVITRSYWSIPWAKVPSLAQMVDDEKPAEQEAAESTPNA